MKNYCGKDCDACAVKEAENCPGCRQYADFGKCEIASCCRDKGHESCATCTQRPWCPTVRKSFSMHKYRREQAEAEASSSRRILENAAVMTKWTLPLFWTLLVLEITGLADTIFENTPPLPLILLGVTILLTLFHGFCLWQMGTVGDRYRKAALFRILSGVLTGLAGLLSLWAGAGNLSVLFSLPGAVLGYIALYHEYNAHGEALAEADGELAEKWENLWKWTIGALIGTFLAVPVSAVLGLIGLLLLIASQLAKIVCRVLELVYLYRTAEVFRWYLDE